MSFWFLHYSNVMWSRAAILKILKMLVTFVPVPCTIAAPQMALSILWVNCNASNKLKFHEYKAGFPHRDLTFPSGIVKAIVHVRACAPSAGFSKPSEFNRGLAAVRAAQTSCGLAETYSQQYTNKPCARLRFSILNAPEFCGRIRRPDSVEVCFGPALSISLWAAAVHGLCVFPN